MDKNIFKTRRDNLKTLLKEKEIEALLVSNPQHRYYLSGFELEDAQMNESSGMLLITATGDDWLFTDSRYKDHADTLWNPENVFIYKQNAYIEMGELIKSQGLEEVGFNENGMLVRTYNTLSKNIKLTPQSGLIEILKQIKSPDEIKSIKNSCSVNNKMFEEISNHFKVGITEKELSWEVEKILKNNGCQGLAFDTIVAFKNNSALPHAIPGETRLEDNSIILIDAGGRLDDYCSDKTRTFFFGNDDSDYQEKLNIVKEAQAAAIKIAKAGTPIKDLHFASVAVFEKYGVEKLFTHNLGHGVGLNCHEAPSLSPRHEGILREGMIITIEPGIYDISWGGIRHEDMFLITKDGCEIL